MKKGIIYTNLLAALAGLIALALLVLPKLQIAPTSQSLGSVTGGNEYFSTSTVSAMTFNNVPKIIKRGSGTLGSIVIASTTSLGNFSVYDATYSTSTASSTIALFPISAAAGTYTYDAVFNAGLVIDASAGFNGNYTITWR